MEGSDGIARRPKTKQREKIEKKNRALGPTSAQTFQTQKKEQNQNIGKLEFCSTFATVPKTQQNNRRTIKNI